MLTVGSAVAVAAFTLALAVIGFYGVRAANRTLLAVREQAQATRQSIEHLVSGERAWVVLMPDSSFAPQVGLHKLDWKIRNQGKSIARITEANAFTNKSGPGFQYPPFGEQKEKQAIALNNVPLPPQFVPGYMVQHA